jgi:PAS domain S-box-containing protein
MSVATKVMVVEDERIVALNLQQRLIKLGYDVPAICARGEQALNVIESTHPDIVLMDINIEGNIDGIETATRLAMTDDTPVVFLTAYSEDATLTRAQAAKPYGYLLKPFSERELHATIQMALERHKLHQQTQAELRSRASDNAHLQSQIRENAEQLELRELATRLVGELALAAEATSRVHEFLGASLKLLGDYGGWHWATACAFKNARQRNPHIVSLFVGGRLAVVDDADINGGNPLGEVLDDLQPWPGAAWLDAAALAQITRSGAYDGLAQIGFWLPLQVAGRLRAGLLFLHSGDSFDRQRWEFLFEHISKELVLFVERKEYQERLRQLSSAIEHSPVSVMITNGGGDIEYVNPHFSTATGYAPDEVLGKNPRLLKSGKMPDSVYADMWRRLMRGETWRGEFHNRKKSGEEFWESSAIAPVIDPRGRITHYVAVKEDITERKRLDQELTAAKESAEEANTAKSAFLANMSHEIRTPLNAILGLNFLLQKTALSPMQTDYVQKTESAAEFLLAILNDILDLSKIEAGKLDLEAVDFNLDGLLQNVRMILQAKADEKHLRLVTDLPDNIPTDFCGDPLRIKQILVNLGGNAIKFTDSGQVTIAVDADQITAESVMLRISVRDTGIGLSDAQQSVLFEVFKQGDASTTRRYGGSGLGLAICKRLVAMMGGEIGVISTPGRGSDFSFSIPLARAQNELRAVALADEANNKIEQIAGARVLLVEDSELNQQVACAIFRYLGVNPEVASNGREALDLIRAHGADHYQLVFMDIQMPEMDGFTATQEIRRLHDTSLLPIVAMTADVLAEDRDRCYAAGMNDYMTKPINIRQLTDVLMRWLGDQ